MKLSTKGRYGTRLMIDLAENLTKGPVLLKDIAERQNISEKYLSRLAAVLKGSGLLLSFRGARGGYKLSRSPELITLKDILISIEGPMTLVGCVGRTPA